jgi:predicted dehydrogenase
VKSATKLLESAKAQGYKEDTVALYSDDSAPGHQLSDLLKRDDIVGVVIVLPILVQPDIVRQALAAGKHVLCEKPIAKDVATAKELVREYVSIYQPKGQIFSIAEQFRFIKGFETAKALVAQKIGQLTQIHLRTWGFVKAEGNKYYETEWRKAPQYQGGFLLDGGVHFTALLRFVSGQEVVQTKSFARQIADHLPPADTINASILTDGGDTGTIAMSFASPKQGWEAHFLGKTGAVSVYGQKKGFRIELLDQDGKIQKEEVDDSNGLDLEVAAFLEAISKGEAQERASAIEGYNDVALVESLLTDSGKVDIWKH